MPYRPPVHRPIVWRPPGADQQRRHPRSAFYVTKEWRKLRAHVLARDGHCCQLRLTGCTERANTAHHRIARELGGADAPWNLISACPSCHNRAHPEKGGH
jgi:5-methylcytosine-specific restriction protein A